MFPDGKMLPPLGWLVAHASILRKLQRLRCPSSLKGSQNLMIGPNVIRRLFCAPLLK